MSFEKKKKKNFSPRLHIQTVKLVSLEENEKKKNISKMAAITEWLNVNVTAVLF